MPLNCCQNKMDIQQSNDSTIDDELSERVKSIMNSVESDSLEDCIGDKCGVFGVVANGDWPTNLDVAHIICLGLVGLQHRGQESAGIVTCKWNHEPYSFHRGIGLVSQIFNEPIMLTLKGNLGIGHTRYSTMGGSDNPTLSQPFIVHTSYGTIAVAHNGELVNSSRLRQRILANGVGLTTGSDSELITQALSMEPPPQFRQNYSDGYRFRRKAKACADCPHCATNTNTVKENSENGVNGIDDDSDDETSPYKGRLSQKDSDFVARIIHLMSLTPLSYSLVLMYDESVYAIRDPFGNRPLCIGALYDSSSGPNHVDGWVVSSESCPFPSVHATLYRDVEPGEIVKLENGKKPKTLAIVPRPDLESPPAFCIFEYVYFAKADSIMENQMVYTVRYKCGRQLAIEAPVEIPEGIDARECYAVAAVPESSNPAAMGFAFEANIPFIEAFCKNRYVGRSFIQPSMRLRRLAVAKKFGPLEENVRGKTIILIDDSIVRGTTIGQLIRLLKDAGAKDVHIRIASPPLHFPCYMGINIPTKEELIANHLKAEQLAHTLGAASLIYLSVEGLKTSVQSGIIKTLKTKNKNIRDDDIREKVGHCTACLTGQYPVKLDF